MPLGFPPADMTEITASFAPLAFTDLMGWENDDHLEAFETFLRSAAAVQKALSDAPAAKPWHPDLAAVCAKAQAARITTTATARTFFEAHFTPHRVQHNGAEGLLTSYYEPVLDGSYKRTSRFKIPLLKRPPYLVNLVGEHQRGAVGSAHTHAKQNADGSQEPMPSREEIERGALSGQGLEFLWLDDAVDVFFLHIQGSGRIRLPTGDMIRVTYDGKNGRPYTSVGRYMIDHGLMTLEGMSLDSMKEWLKADAERGRRAMWVNTSYIFFRILEGAEADAPVGVMHIPLTTGRSLAVDTGFHVIGTPVYVVAPEIKHMVGSINKSFTRLMVAQDVGSAIRGPERGDLYAGSGAEAGAIAGITKHPGRYFALLPKGAKLVS
jgi:membrane-bound lytic murein transglycosylase A